MIRCVRLWTGADNNSHFEEGVIALEQGVRGDALTGKLPVTTVSFQETASGGSFAWHDAPVLQLVITLSGTLDFETRGAAHFSFCIPAISCLPRTQAAAATNGSWSIRSRGGASISCWRKVRPCRFSRKRDASLFCDIRAF